MLLPLLGACVLVGPFQGPEWEPVQGLLSQCGSCRDPRCCGNLIVLCLFLIWQVRHYWQQFNQTQRRKRKVIQVRSQDWAVPSTRHSTVLRSASEFITGPSKLTDIHRQRWTQKQRWEYWKSLQKSWARCLLSWQGQCQGPHWGAHTHLEPILGTTSFTNTCLLPQDNSWDTSQVPCLSCLSDGDTNLDGKPLPLSLEMYQRTEHLLVPSSEEFKPLKPTISVRSHPTSMFLASSLSHLSSEQRLHFWSREFLPAPSHEQMEMPTWKSWGCPQESQGPEMENQTPGRGGENGESPASTWGNQRENREDGGEAQAAIGMTDGAEAEILGWGNQRLITSETHGRIIVPGWEDQDHMGSKTTGKVQELGKKNQRHSVSENPPESQAYVVKNQEQLGWRTDTATQTSEWQNQDECGGKDAAEIQAFVRENKNDPTEEEEGEIQAQRLGKQGQLGRRLLTYLYGEKTQMLGQGKQDKCGGDNKADIQAERWTNKDQVGGEAAVSFQSSGKENLGQVREEDSIKTQTLEWRKQEWFGSESTPEFQTPGWENQDQHGSKKASGEEIKLKLGIPIGWGKHSLLQGEDPAESQMSQRKKLREIREEDWVVIQGPGWGSERVLASETDLELERPCWDNQGQTGDEQRVESWTPESRNKRQSADKDGAETWALGKENQSQLREEADIETHPLGRGSQEQFGKESCADTQVPGETTLKGVRSEGSKGTQGLEEENQGQLRSEISETIGRATLEYFRCKDDANNWGKSTTEINREAHLAGWKKEEVTVNENSGEIQVLEKRNQREVRGKDYTETLAAGEGNQSQLRSDRGGDAHFLKWKKQKQVAGETGTETQAPGKNNQRGKGGDSDGVETQGSESENQGQLDGEMDGQCSLLRKMNREQAGGESHAENQASEKRNQKDGLSNNCMNICKIGGENKGQSTSKANGKTSPSEWKNQEQMGGEDDVEIKIQGERILKGTESDSGSRIQAPGGDYQEELKSECYREIQTQGEGSQNKAGDEDAVETQDVKSQPKYGVEDTGRPTVPGHRKKNQPRGKDAGKAHRQFDCAGGDGPMCREHNLEWPLAFTGSGYGATEQGQAMTVNSSVSRPEAAQLGKGLLLASGAEEHLAWWGRSPAKDIKAGVWEAQSESQRGQQKDKDWLPGKASSLTQQPQNPQSVAALGMPSARSSLQCHSNLQAATTFVGTSTALTDLPKGPALKKSRLLLLESLMRRKIAHLRWGLPHRILQSYFLLNFSGSCPVPTSGVGSLRLYTGQEFQGQQKKLYEAQGYRPCPNPPVKPRRIQRPGGRTALEKCGPHRPELLCKPNHPEKPRSSRPPGVARDRQVIQKAPTRNLRPDAQSRSWCSGERAREPSGKTSRDREMVRPVAPLRSERAPSRVWCSGSRASRGPSCKLLQPTYCQRGNAELSEGEGAWHQPFSFSADLSSFKGSLQSTVARLSMTILNKMPRSPQSAQPLHFDLTSLPDAGDPHTGEGSIQISTSLEMALQSPGHQDAGALLPMEKSPKEQGAPGNPNKASGSPQKFVFMKNLRSFLLRLGFRK